MIPLPQIVNLTYANQSIVIQYAAELLQSGQIIISPTDTIYGLLADYFNPDARNRLRIVKNRPADKSFLVLISDYSWFDRLSPTPIPDYIQSYIPGPVTLVMENRYASLYGEFSLAIRLPDHEFLQTLIHETQTPLMAPSANVGDKPYLPCIQKIYADFNKEIPFFIDAGVLDSCLPSSVIDIRTQPIQVLRDERKLFTDLY